MAKTKKYRRYYGKKSKWSSNIQEINNQLINIGTGTTFSASTPLALNPTQTAQGVSQVYTVKNFECSFTLEIPDSQQSSAPASALEGLSCYIMYVPQGMTLANDYNVQHPEYILAYKYYGSPASEYVGATGQLIHVGQQYQPIKIRTRMARRLNTGDSVVLFIKGTAPGGSTYQLALSGLVRWWTKAN